MSLEWNLNYFANIILPRRWKPKCGSVLSITCRSLLSVCGGVSLSLSLSHSLTLSLSHSIPDHTPQNLTSHMRRAAGRLSVLQRHISVAKVKRQMSAAAVDAEREPEVILGAVGAAAVMTLNRPAKLNALSLPMVRDMTSKYRDLSGAVWILRGNGKAFCAGGDVAGVRAAGLSNDTSLTRDFFYEEYQLNEMLGAAKGKPHQVSIWDGITMGGGVGLSVHGKYRVCTERVLFAKPETAIGLFPDVGGSHFLGRLPGGVGPYIALTGARLKAADLMYTGIATHYISSDLVDELCHLLGEISPSLGVGEAEDAVTSTLQYLGEKSAVTLEPGSGIVEKNRQVIDGCFANATSVEEIMTNLEGHASTFAKDTLSTLHQMSPTSLKLTLEQVRRGARIASLGECLQMEFRMVQRLMKNTESDFYEGIRAVLVDKDRNPQWKPAAVGDVSDDFIASFFAPLSAEEELRFT